MNRARFLLILDLKIVDFRLPPTKSMLLNFLLSTFTFFFPFIKKNVKSSVLFFSWSVIREMTMR